MYFMQFKHFPKLFRLTTGASVMQELSEAMQWVVKINFYKNSKHKEAEQIELWILTLQGKIEIVKSYILMGWELKIITHGFFMQMSNALEEVSKQTSAWGKWLVNKKENNLEIKI